MRNTKISFAQHTWNPLRATYNGKIGWACVKHGHGCEHCYAERLNIDKGTGLEFSRDSLNKVELLMNKGSGQTGISEPLSVKKSSVFFANSMTDWLWDGYPTEWSMFQFGVMSLATNHVFITLTKRYRRLAGLLATIAQTPQRTITLPAEKPFEKGVFRAFQKKRYFDINASTLRIQLTTHGMGEGARLPFVEHADVPFTPRNVIFGVSASTNNEMDVAITLMKNLRVTFPDLRTMISYEPAIEIVDLSRLEKGDIDWIDVGGESDSFSNQGKARPFEIGAWFKVLEFGDRTETPVFFKQAGSVYAREHGLKERKGEDLTELPEEWNVRREFPSWDTWMV